MTNYTLIFNNGNQLVPTVKLCALEFPRGRLRRRRILFLSLTRWIIKNVIHHDTRNPSGHDGRRFSENSGESGAGREILFIHEKTDCRGDLYPRKIIQTLPRAISFSVHPRRRTAGLNRFSSARRRKRLDHTGENKKELAIFALPLLLSAPLPPPPAPSFSFTLGALTADAALLTADHFVTRGRRDVNNRRKVETYICASPLTIKAPFTVRILYGNGANDSRPFCHSYGHFFMKGGIYLPASPGGIPLSPRFLHPPTAAAFLSLSARAFI